jgi:hypothetical protein
MHRIPVDLDPVSPPPRTLLPTNEISDFDRNLRQLEKGSKRPYSLAKVIRERGSDQPRLTGLEMEVHQELRALNRGYEPMGTLVPMQALSKRDLSIATYP